LKKKEKEIFIADMKDRLQRAQATFLVDYQGLNVESMNRVRGELRDIGIEFRVVKNRLLELASQDTDTSSIKEYFVGPCALAITYDDIIAPAKVLVGLSKDYKKLEIKKGQISGRPIDVEAIKRLAVLPGRDDLLAQVLSAMQAVPTSLVRVLNGVLANLLNVLKAIEATKNGDKKNE
jgi:large subunit ribosomal protein L10